MKKSLLIVGLVALAVSCQKKEQLIEVDVPSVNGDANNTSSNHPDQVIAKQGAFKMQGLAYGYQELEPYIDAKTVEIHYSKHHLGYCDNLNDAVRGTEWEAKSIEETLTNLNLEDTALRNNAGGYYNHNLYWDIVAPKKGGKPTGKIAEYINRDFGSFENFKHLYKTTAMKLFGSGWVWLVVKSDGTLAITTSINQDNPLMPNAEIKGYPLLNTDLWEHSYYLKYANNRGEYIDNFFNLINWDKVNYRINLKQ